MATRVMPNLDFLGLSVLELVRGTRQTDRQTDRRIDRHHLSFYDPQPTIIFHRTPVAAILQHLVARSILSHYE